MPGAGFGHPVLGPAAFIAIKFAGYSAAAVAISETYRRSDLNPLVVGTTRTGIGLAFGAVAVFLTSALGFETGTSLFLIALVPVRFIEWWLLVWLFYDRQLAKLRLGWEVALLGTIWSFVLDIPTIIGLVIVGKFELVC